MKIDGADKPRPDRPRARFPVPLKRPTTARTATAPRQQPAARAGAVAAARAGVQVKELKATQDARQQHLVADRSHALETNAAGTQARLEELIRQELNAPPRAEEARPARGIDPDLRNREQGRPAAGDGELPGVGERRAAPAAPASAGASTRAEAILALAERIEVMMKSGRPALELSVGGGLQARVRVERTGRAEVALTVAASAGRLDAATLDALRAAIEARGLRLSALRTG